LPSKGEARGRELQKGFQNIKKKRDENKIKMRKKQRIFLPQIQTKIPDIPCPQIGSDRPIAETY
jgi:hypothetical protein